MARGLANARPPGSAKFANAPPPGLTRRANAPQLPGGGGGGLGAGGIDWCIIFTMYTMMSETSFRLIHCNTLKFQDKPSLRTGQNPRYNKTVNVATVLKTDREGDLPFSLDSARAFSISGVTGSFLSRGLPKVLWATLIIEETRGWSDIFGKPARFCVKSMLNNSLSSGGQLTSLRRQRR